MKDKKVALITGANKGIGFEIAKQLGRKGIVVLIGARNDANGLEAARTLNAEGVESEAITLDITDAATITKAAQKIENQYGRLDILINNAGIVGGPTPSPSEVTVAMMRKVYETNVFGAIAVTTAMLPLLRKSDQGRIVNMSSGLGSLTLASEPGSEFFAFNIMPYQSSKTALNAVTVAFAKELKDSAIKVNSADPGYTATDLNAHRGYRSVEQAAIVPVRLATLQDDGPTGTFQDEDGVIPW
jgi:NAD(P)-dependent dehydrogenase (short-subunit alcohol dehydrogenase family)